MVASVEEALRLGADGVSTHVTASCPVPVLTAGGERLTDETAVRTFVQDVLAGGGGGIAMGRNVFEAPDPAGAQVLAVDTKGQTRPVTVGRVKIESRPLLSIDAVSADGVVVNLIVQDDWHVRVLGPGGSVLNSTELKPGDRVLGFLPTEDRHVGYPIDEFCLEK